MEEFQFLESPIIDYGKISDEFFENNSCKLFNSSNYKGSDSHLGIAGILW